MSRFYLFFCILFSLLIFSFVFACDMFFIENNTPDEGPDEGGVDSNDLTDDEREELERTGHFLKIINMPLHTQITNVSSVQVTNSVSTIGRFVSRSIWLYNESDPDNESDSCTLYIPLVYNDNTEFTETGSFYVAFEIHVDAVTVYRVTLSDLFLVPFIYGQGTVDILSLPGTSTGDNNNVLTDDEREELERTGHFLKIINMPLHTQITNVSSVQIANSVSTIARFVSRSIWLYNESDSCTLYIPLVYNDNTKFTETGSFYVAFEIHVDAVTVYRFTLSDLFLVPFINGQGTVDILSLPGTSTGDNNNVLTDDEKEELERTGHFLKIINMTANTQITNVSSVQIANSVSTIARFVNKSIWLYNESDSCTLYIPLVYNDNTEFTETGSFYVAFQIIVDVLTMYRVRLTDMFLVPFVNGQGTVDILNLPVTPVYNDSNVLTSVEKSELERTGRFLKIINMPLHTQSTNVFSAQIANSSSVIGKFNNTENVWLYNESDSCTLYIPLVYNDNTEFIETGSFYIALEILVDVLTIYSVNLSDRFIIPFVNGRGTVDVRSLPGREAPPIDYRYLVIYNLPANISLQNISGISIHNQAGSIASCLDYSTVQISVNDNRAVARIPLSYNNSKFFFAETGVFYVSFDINIDVDIRYLITVNDRVRVSFLNGSGFLDIENIPANIVPYLTIHGLPYYTTAKQITNVSVYNLAGSVASCRNYNDITVFRENNYVTARIPLSSSDGGNFLNTGRFAVSFTVNVDVETQISFSRDDNLILNFSDGSAVFDYVSTFGHFDARLTSAAKPAIMGGSSFDINGYRHTVSSDLPINAYVPLESCVLYLYAFRVESDVYYEFSKTVPEYNTNRRGFYNGLKRALWKMIYLYDVDQYLFKTYVADDFPQLDTAVISNASFNSFSSGRPAHYSLFGSDNPTAATVTLQPGVYIVKLSGAGGGGGYGAVSDSTVTGSSSGGSGGIVYEIITINTAASFTAYTGSGGAAASAPAPSGIFSISATKNIFTSPPSSQTVYTDTVLNSLVQTNFSAISGGGGGGGGSGTFLYSADGYFLVAGGGGGGSGASWLTPGGGGGAGGAIGPGGGGGAAGYFQQSFKTTVAMTAEGGHGGNGGGLNGGSGGQSSSSTSNRAGGSAVTASALYSNTNIPGGNNTPSYDSSVFNIPSSSISNLHYHQQMSATTWALYYGSESSVPSITFHMSYAISGDSGSGGAAAAVSHPSGPMEWLNTISVQGIGGSAGTLNPSSITGSFNYKPNQSSTDWNDNLTPAQYQSRSTFSFTLGSLITGVNGTDGGNNRNSSRGGGAPGGSVVNSMPSDGGDGSLVIYKIY